MDQEIRNKLRNVVTQCRKLLEDSISQDLEGKYGIFAKKDQVTADPNAPMTHLANEEQAARKDILDHFAHIKARGFKPKDALDQLVREIAFTHLNRFCAYKMMEAREVYVGGHKFREAVSRGIKSNGFLHYLGMDGHEDDERLYATGKQDVAYRHFLDWLGGLLSDEIGVLFNPNDSANRLHPRQKTLDEVVELLNSGGIKPEETELREGWSKIWSQDETLGWVYQYFTPKELRDQSRKESQAPRNSYELAFRNQFFTPRYVVEFLTDNTLGRIWYDMRKGDTSLKDQCQYLVRRPIERFLMEGAPLPKDALQTGDLSQEQLINLPVQIPHRAKRDPRELRILDPACGSGHFLLYCFDLLVTIYEEAYTDADLGSALQRDYPKLEDLRRDVPRLILTQNIHGIDIDLRCTQIAALALWLRCQRAYQDMGVKQERSKITRSNFVCAEPMPGEEYLLEDFVSQLEPRLLSQLVEVVFDKMRIAGEAGSLLQIEVEIRDAVAQAKKEWLVGSVSVQRNLFDDGRPVARQQRFDFLGVTDAEFFEHAEAKVVAALRNYVERAHNGQGLQRRLFTDDAVRGFAFVDLCRKRYDVVLMNPPFGQPAEASRALIDEKYSEVKVDIAIAFISRALDMLHDGGKVGVLATRTCLFLNNLVEWRQKRLSATSLLECLADLGYGVLHGAMVEAAAFSIGKTPLSDRSSARATFISALRTELKSTCVLTAINDFHNGIVAECVHIERLAGFDVLPRTPFAYWISERTRKSIASLGSFRKGRREAQEGLSTKNDERFLRAAWEVPIFLLGKTHRWHYIAKGGEYSPYYDDIHLVVDWADNGKVLEQSIIDKYLYLNGNAGWVLHPSGRYFEPGLTFPLRTTSDFSPRILPAGCRFSLGGQAIFFENPRSGLFYLAIAYSRVYKMLVEMFIGSGDSSVSGTAARNYVSGVINDIPFEYPDSTLVEAMIVNAETVARRFQRFWKADETSRIFLRCLAVPSEDSIRSCVAALYCQFEDDFLFILNVSHEAEVVSQKTYGLTDAEFVELDNIVAPHPLSYPTKDTDELVDVNRLYQQGIDSIVDELCEKRGPTRHYTKKAYFADRRLELISHLLGTHPFSIVKARRERQVLPNGLVESVTADFVSYCFGVSFGRFDVRNATPKVSLTSDKDVFEGLQSCSPGMLTGKDGLPVTTVPDDYPLRFDFDGILPDDFNSPDDLVRRVRQVIEVIWKERAEAIEKEASEIIGTKELREYFRRPGPGGFWNDHVSRYSKSRRKAPIYWLLQSSKKNYSLWLYYHRLDKDLLFKGLVNYVAPKTRLETSRLETLRGQKAAAGESVKEIKRIAKEIERQEDFLSELKEFEDTLRSAANLHLEPDLNDGVVLNIAPLYELVPWKEAKNYWDELLEGKYEWSSIGKQLRQKGLVKS